MSKVADPVLIGKFTGVYGVKGWVKVFSYTQPKENILSYKNWMLRRPDGWQSVDMLEGKLHGKKVIVRLAGCDDRDQAAALMDIEVAILPDQLAQLSEDEFYWSQIIGLEVITTTGENLGQVSELIETGANDVLVVGEDCLIPFARPEIVKAIDLDKGKITVEWSTDYN